MVNSWNDVGITMPFNAMFTTNFPGNGEHTSTICGDDWEMVSYIDTHIKLIGLSFCTLFLAEILFGLVSSRIWVMNQCIFFWVSKKLVFPPLKWRWTSPGDQPFNQFQYRNIHGDSRNPRRTRRPCLGTGQVLALHAQTLWHGGTQSHFLRPAGSDLASVESTANIKTEGPTDHSQIKDIAYPRFFFCVMLGHGSLNILQDIFYLI